MVIAFAFVVFFWLLVGCAFVCWDVSAECRFQAEQAELERFWAEQESWAGGDPCRNTEAVQATGAAE